MKVVKKDFDSTRFSIDDVLDYVKAKKKALKKKKEKKKSSNSKEMQ